MTEYLPILIVGAIIGVFTTLFLVAWAILKRHKEDMTDRERHMSDREIITRLLRYAKPYWKSFVAVGIIMLFSIAYEVASPLLMGAIQGLVKQENFQLSRLYSTVSSVFLRHRVFDLITGSDTSLDITGWLIMLAQSRTAISAVHSCLADQNPSVTSKLVKTREGVAVSVT